MLLPLLMNLNMFGPPTPPVPPIPKGGGGSSSYKPDHDESEKRDALKKQQIEEDEIISIIFNTIKWH